MKNFADMVRQNKNYASTEESDNADEMNDDSQLFGLVLQQKPVIVVVIAVILYLVKLFASFRRDLINAQEATRLIQLSLADINPIPVNQPRNQNNELTI